MFIGANIAIEGMTCHGCSASIKLALEGTPGVDQAEVNFDTGQAHVFYDARLIRLTNLCDVISHLGYRAQLIEA